RVTPFIQRVRIDFGSIAGRQVRHDDLNVARGQSDGFAVLNRHDDEAIDDGSQDGTAIIVDVISEQLQPAGRQRHPRRPPSRSKRRPPRTPRSLECRRCNRVSLRPVLVPVNVRQFSHVKPPRYRRICTTLKASASSKSEPEATSLARSRTRGQTPSPSPTCET